MRIVELSNHPDAQLQKTHQARREAEERAQSDYSQALARHGSHLAEIREHRQTARAQGHWRAWLRWTLRLRRARRAAPRPQQLTWRSSAQEEILEAGIEGEQQVATQLDHVLGDDWTLLRGYRNRRGEIDHLLLGPRGLLAIESKHRNATVHCDGDTWWFDKYDRYGNHVGQGTITDGGGRSPSQQLNEPAADLEAFLASRGHRVTVQRMVLLTHPRSRLGTCRNRTASIGTSASDVISLLNSSPPMPDPLELRQLQDLIVRDHRFHQRRRSGVRH
jgi:Nuclease-related domain